MTNGGCKFKREERRVGVKGDIRKLFKVYNLFLLVTEGCLQNFRNLEQPLLGKKYVTRKKRRERKIIPKIVDTKFRCNAQGQRTHFAQTNYCECSSRPRWSWLLRSTGIQTQPERYVKCSTKYVKIWGEWRSQVYFFALNLNFILT